jgi:signal transduction histidine kinase/ligand-binding sensor domain-containing protein/DNA-binding NarL/FixJ family response regulator
MRKKSQQLITLVFLLVLFQSLFAETFSIRKYNYQNGLPSDKVLCVRQDKIGRIWLGTTRGLSCFDGSEFHNFSKQQRGARHLSHNLAQAILPMNNGDVWVATPDSLNIYDYKNDQMRTVGAESGLTFPDVTALAHGVGCEWVGTFGRGLFRYDHNTKRFVPVNIVNSHEGTKEIMSICEDSNHQLWIGTRYDGLFLYNLNSKVFRKVKGKAGNAFIRIIYQDLSGNIWIGSSTGFYYIQGGVIIEVEAADFKSKCVFDITEQPAGTIWVAGEEIFLNFKTENFFESPINTKTTSLTKSTFKDINTLKGIHSILKDDHKNMWIGSYGEGLNLLISDRVFQHIIPETNLPLGNIPSTVSDIQINKAGQLWIAKEGSGLIKYNSFSQRVESNFPFFDGSIKSVFEDHKGNLWVGGNSKGLAIQKKGKSGFVRFNKNIGIQVRKIFQTSDNSLYVSGNEGLFKTNSEGDSWTNVLGKWFSKNPDVRCVAETPDKTLWMGTYNTGLLCYDPLHNKLQQLLIKNGLKSNIIFDLFREYDNLWIATDDGLASYSLSQKKFNNEIPCNLLAGVSVFAIQKDLNGDLWFSTSTGIVKYQRKHRELKKFSFNGLPPVGEFSEGCSAIDGDGNIYFGGLNGILYVKANRKNANQEYKYELLFTKLMLFDQHVTPNDHSIDHNPLKENINIQRLLSFNASQSMFSIHFSIPNFDSEVTYSYRLEGIDKEWNQLGTQNWVTFRNLGPKKYKLQVRAYISNHENPIEASLNFEVNPPLWLSWWAKLLYFLMFFSLSTFFWRQSKERLKLSHTIELEQAFRRRDDEIHEAKLVFFTNISHELRTPLTLLIAPLEKLIDNESNLIKQKTLKLIYKNANRLLLLVNQILDFRKTEKGEMQLQVQEVVLVEWADEIIQSFSEMAKDRKVTLNTVYNDNTEIVWIDSALMEKVCFNLLSNAFKFTPVGGQVSFILCVDEKWMTIKVIDNGVGIQNESKKLVFNRFFQEKTLLSSGAKQTGTGIGLHLVKSIVELHHGVISLSSEPGTETVFTVAIPWNKDDYESNEIQTVKAINADVLTPDELNHSNTKFELTDGQCPQILIVEDNDDLREYLQEALSERFKVLSCVNGQEAITKVHNYEIDIIVCDVMMPVMDGLETCRILKSDIETNYIPIILLTAKSGFDDMIQGLEHGADAYISKPFNLNHLIAQINRILENRAILRSKYLQPMLSLLKENKESAESKFMDEITELILEHISDENLNGNVLASYFLMSRTSLHRKLKSVAGISSGDLIRNIRLAKAAKELVSTEMTISEISFQNGFNSPSYFSLCFTNYFGKSPTAYRTI